MELPKKINQALVASVTPYFLEKQAVWFEENLSKILEARKTQSFFEDNVLYIERNQSFNFSHFLRKLDEMGYEKVLKVTEPGEFSQRGGVIDVFPVNIMQATRFDFLGNKIENIELLDIKIEDEKKSKKILNKKLKSQKIFSDLKGSKPGDYLVHLDHGIGIFLGIEKSQTPAADDRSISENQFPDTKEQEHYIIEYAAGDKLYVPIGLERKLSRYIGFTDPKISRLGSVVWQQTKKKIKEETEKFAKEILEVCAKREISQRQAYLPPDDFDRHVSESFKYETTPDQAEAIEEIRKDLEKQKPMDRVVCGDVGFGKTEVALRAIIKVVKSGYQAVLISPTTILANQHFNNFKERLKNLPVRVALLTRLQTKKEQERLIKELQENRIDILIGTHRLLSNDVAPLLFGNEGIGLLIIDDEQRFGVKQKEKLKQLRSKIDILSLSATPIPRTLYATLSSLKDMSIIQTPPEGRLPIKTFLLSYSDDVVRKAIEAELKRNGQVYYLHNRVETIEAVKKYLEKLLPGVKFGIAHGRMREKELIKTMNDFQNKKIDALVSTTIIENGLDLPNVNTLVVADSSRLGLSQAYQLRGRIGRSGIQSFAYFLHSCRLKGKAKIRMEALKEAEALGSGYRVALRDLEMRGAGNILGKEQSGSINRIGLNLYCQMLSESVDRLKITEPAPIKS